MRDVLKHCQYIFELQEKGMTSIRDSIQGDWYRFRNRADSNFITQLDVFIVASPPADELLRRGRWEQAH